MGIEFIYLFRINKILYKIYDNYLKYIIFIYY
jgi:hypothetical protein